MTHGLVSESHCGEHERGSGGVPIVPALVLLQSRGVRWTCICHVSLSPPPAGISPGNNWASLTHGPAAAEDVNHSLKLPPDSFSPGSPMARSSQQGMCLLAAALPTTGLPGMPPGRGGRESVRVSPFSSSPGSHWNPFYGSGDLRAWSGLGKVCQGRSGTISGSPLLSTGAQ